MEELDVVEALRLDELIGRKVRHFKGKEYLVLGTVIHTETLETMVLYKALYGTCETFVRPIKMFAKTLYLQGFAGQRRLFFLFFGWDLADFLPKGDFSVRPKKISAYSYFFSF